jgi:putative ABC transport system substrate-binding protein
MTLARLVAALVAVALPLTAAAQPAAKIPRIGYLSSNRAAAVAPLIEVFRQGLQEHGWVDGQNVIIETRYAEGQFDRLPGLMDELVRLNVDVIVAGPTPSAIAASKGTRTIPIVMASVADPVKFGLVTSLARPGGNVTGVAFSVGLEIFGKGLELLKDTLPEVRRVAILWNPANPAHAVAVKDVRAAAGPLGIELRALEGRGPSFERVFADMAKARVDAVMVVADATYLLHRARLAELATRSRLPSMHGLRENVEAGGLMSYGPSLRAIYRRTAVYVDKILRGARPGDLPVEQPTTFELVVNLRTAKAIGLTIPQPILARADEIIGQ